jgi:hypothetical protein
MKPSHTPRQQALAAFPILCAALSALLLSPITILLADDAAKASPAGAGELVPLVLRLPAPAFQGTPKDIPVGTTVEPPSDKPRPPLLVPPGLKNLAHGKKVISSDKNALASSLEKITDGDKEASDDSTVLLRKGTQHVQLDFGAPHELFAVALWHAHNAPKVYHDVVVQVADDPDFIDNVRTIFNNDQDNSSGLGIGTDREYFETNQGRTIEARGVKARYLRCYSKGSTESALNEYTEIEVYGRPAS